jgi:hypothetical protein
VVIGVVLALVVRISGIRAQAEEARWELRVTNVHDMYGVDVMLIFDASVVEVIDVDPEQPGVQIAPGPLFQDQQLYFVAYNRVTQNRQTGAGTISFVATLLNPAEPIDGDGIIATIPYQLVDPSVSTTIPFTIQQAQLASRGGGRMLVEWEGNTIRQVFRAHLPLLSRGTLKPFLAD